MQPIFALLAILVYDGYVGRVETFVWSTNDENRIKGLTEVWESPAEICKTNEGLEMLTTLRAGMKYDTKLRTPMCFTVADLKLRYTTGGKTKEIPLASYLMYANAVCEVEEIEGLKKHYKSIKYGTISATNVEVLVWLEGEEGLSVNDDTQKCRIINYNTVHRYLTTEEDHLCKDIDKIHYKPSSPNYGT